jgi:hypothetical protein
MFPVSIDVLIPNWESLPWRWRAFLDFDEVRKIKKRVVCAAWRPGGGLSGGRSSPATTVPKYDTIPYDR